MTLTIELTPAQEACLSTAAQQQGLDPQTLAHQFVIQHLPDEFNTRAEAAGTTSYSPNSPVSSPLQVTNGKSVHQEPVQAGRDPERVARVRSARGILAHLGQELASEQLHRERQADRLREEQLLERIKS